MKPTSLPWPIYRTFHKPTPSYLSPFCSFCYSHTGFVPDPWNCHTIFLLRTLECSFFYMEFSSPGYFAQSAPSSKSPWASLVAQWWRIHLSVQETWVQSLGKEDPLEKEIATHSSILAWKIPWTEEPGELQSLGYSPWGKESAMTSQMSTHACKPLFNILSVFYKDGCFKDQSWG